jgi:hypothetical protein
MEKDEKKSEVVEEKVSEATEEIATPTPYKHPNRNLMDKEIETTATEESKEESDEKKPEEEHPVGVEDAVFKKRYDDLKRHYDETVNKHKDELLKLKKEEEMQEELLKIKKQQTALARDRAEVELAKKHPDFKEIRDSSDFHDWASVQDSTIQSWLYDNTDNPKSAARAIDLYKYDRGLSTKKVNYDAKKEAAKAVSKTKVSETPSEKKTWKWAEIQKMKPDVYAKFEEEIDKAHREGRIV